MPASFLKRKITQNVFDVNKPELLNELNCCKSTFYYSVKNLKHDRALKIKQFTDAVRNNYIMMMKNNLLLEFSPIITSIQRVFCYIVFVTFHFLSISILYKCLIYVASLDELMLLW